MSNEIIKKLREDLLNFDSEAVEKTAKEALDEGVSPLEAVNVLTSTIRELGEMYERLEIFVPELMMAAEAMKSGIAILEPELLKQGGRETLGTFVIGAVEGDIHDIGKTIVATMLTTSGFKVIDLGTDVSASAFAEAVKKHSPALVGASSLMTTTMIKLDELVNYFKEIGIREKVKILIGGAVVTKEYAEKIGADGYGATAVEAAEIAKKLVTK